MSTIKTIDTVTEVRYGASMINVKHARKNIQMTQVILAKRLGISQQLVSDWETGKATPSTRDEYAIRWLSQLVIDEAIADCNKKLIAEGIKKQESASPDPPPGS